MEMVYILFDERIDPFDPRSTIFTNGIIYSIKSLHYDQILCFMLFDKFVTNENKRVIKTLLEVEKAPRKLIQLYSKYIKVKFKKRTYIMN